MPQARMARSSTRSTYLRDRVGKALSIGSVALLALSVLGGCDLEIEGIIKFSQFGAERPQLSSGYAYLDVDSCDGMVESNEGDIFGVTPRHPQRSYQARDILPMLLPGATYVECAPHGDRKTTLKNEIGVAIENNSSARTLSQFILLNHDGSLYFVIPDLLRKRISNARKATSEIRLTKMTVRVIVNNDTGSDVVFESYSAFVNDVPSAFPPIVFCARANSTYVLRLSDVSMEQALIRGETQVLRIHREEKCTPEMSTLAEPRERVLHATR